ncbi:MAG: glycoside hydrolase family 2 TIM barrel-domain containing protein [Bacteroidota bacterium]|nr:glycoside hydrolase family 2 TIM barrel-domain containing protein [Bacteroidota bacterium]
MRKYTYPILFLALCLVIISSCGQSSKIRNVWTKEEASEWYKQKTWLRGCNFIPSTAINQLEMWQAETFDTVTINRELGWASSIGMNAMRVFLHHAAWQADSAGFKNRMEQYLTIANKYGIVTLFVLFDDCWNPTYQLGKQPEPKVGVHNSGWLRDPGDIIYKDSTIVPVLHRYVKDVLTYFANDKRIVMWDLYNEPGNSNYGNKSLPLLKKVFVWAREVNPSQPLTSGVWNLSLGELNKFQVENSDVISYHNYQNDSLHSACIDTLKRYGKPMFCTEYMARKHNSRFDNIMPLLKKEKIAAINWGLVSGKTNTIYAWDEPHPDGSEPALWFHDIFRKDGTPYKVEETELIKNLTETK